MSAGIDDKAFGRYVKRLREARGLTQEQLAERADLAADTIRRLEHTDFSPSLRTLRKLCKALRISVGTLFAGLEMSEADPTYEELMMVLRGQQPSMLKLVLRITRSLLKHLEQSEANKRSR